MTVEPEALVFKQSCVIEFIVYHWTDTAKTIAMNLTGYTPTAIMKEFAGSTATIATFTCTASTPANGQVTMFISAAVDIAAGNYVYDLKLTPVDATRIIRTAYGTIKIIPKVTP
jgi:hypothetical protein